MGTVLVRFGELFLKSENVRRLYLRKLQHNMDLALTASGVEHEFEVHRDRLLVHGPDAAAIARVAARTFGLVDVAVCTQTGPTIPQMGAAAFALARRHLRAGMSFAVRARRQDVEGMTSQQIGAEVGSVIYDAIPGLRVDLSYPDYEVFVEARPYGGLVYDERVPAPGGLPFGTQERVLSLLSAGIDSPVATWQVMRRGCLVTHLTFDGGRWQGADVRDAVRRHHAALSTWCMGHPLDLLVADMEPFFEAMTAAADPHYRCLLCKRFMFRVASGVAGREGALALVTGDNLGQVASQTLANLGVIEAAADLPVLRPLLTYEKNEAVALARRIGTFDEDAGDLSCAAVPKRPATQAKLAMIEKEEAKFDLDGLVEEAVAGVRRVRAKNGVIVREDKRA
ncbi:tRNA 4-thiouridine(8) synthase ThiI [Methanofollis formosanus]|uniref:Probable tRNA sulfurtransferase n=1 Tax=Methanofollis formosanus TaxID=299308 RepID=A0A8G1A2K0_9EURY|nr:tRNA uracil 4-sulfurtransferase ThiI [Methanofollis formosanus]QYZ79910.1 tRNA 4-thiouridine(8) synthase ThiI [Methanofollis formosanus]